MNTLALVLGLVAFAVRVAGDSAGCPGAAVLVSVGLATLAGVASCRGGAVGAVGGEQTTTEKGKGL